VWEMTRSVLTFLNKLEEGIIWIIMLEMALLSFSQVVMRYVFHTAFSWSEEVLRYQMVFITFFGASLGVKYDAHISVKALQMSLPDRFSYCLRLAILVISCAFSFVLCYYSTLLTLNVRNFGQLTPALGIPSFIPYLSIPVGSFLMGVRFGIQFFSVLREHR
jgi:TRAP-type C4-dicarboxylate transport system permease small subunit